MRFWVDTEFNSFGGELISIALIAEDNAIFYAVLEHGHMKIHPWVSEHVIPKLGLGQQGIEVVTREVASKWLADFLAPYDTVHLVADWPDDIAYFCGLLITGPGNRIDTPPLTMEIRRDLDGVMSLNPHNALADAIAIRRSHFELKGK